MRARWFGRGFRIALLAALLVAWALVLYAMREPAGRAGPAGNGHAALPSAAASAVGAASAAGAR